MQCIRRASRTSVRKTDEILISRDRGEAECTSARRVLIREYNERPNICETPIYIYIYIRDRVWRVREWRSGEGARSRARARGLHICRNSTVRRSRAGSASFFLADGGATIQGACRVPASKFASREHGRRHASATSRAATVYLWLRHVCSCSGLVHDRGGIHGHPAASATSRAATLYIASSYMQLQRPRSRPRRHPLQSACTQGPQDRQFTTYVDDDDDDDDDGGGGGLARFFGSNCFFVCTL